MPWNRREIIQLSLLLLCVPLQYLLSSYFNNYNSSQRDQMVVRVIANARRFSSQYFRWEPWKVWCLEVFKNIQELMTSSGENDDTLGESPAVEVFRYRDKQGHFAGSPDIRSERPPNVLYKVGQMVVHKTIGYRGVIVGWDSVAKAPETWLKMMHPEGKEHWKKMPNYAVLVDVRDRPNAQMTYVPQDNLQLVTGTKIIHPKLESYFSKFNGEKYTPLPWLKILYPKDD